MEYFGGEALIFTKFFRGKPIFHGNSSGVKAILANLQGYKQKVSPQPGWGGWGVQILKFNIYNAIAQCTIIIDPYINQY